MSELTLTVMRLGLLVLLWLFVFSIVGVLRGDIYGTRVRRRPARVAQAGAAPAPTVGTPVAAPAPKPSRRGPTKLTVTEGPLAGTSLPLRPTGTLIGRSPECALVLDDDYASGRHARIHLEDGTWFVEDLGSTNGTFLGSTRITEPRVVTTGSVIRIGQTAIELQR